MQLLNENLIKKWEKLRLEAYLPTPNDVPTIGWGHTRGVKLGMTISKAKAEELFKQDVKWAVDAVNENVVVTLNQKQFDALVSFVFNIGETNFKKSTLLKKLNAGNYTGAADELLKWVKQKGVTLRGLVRRRQEEREYFLSESISEIEPTVQSVDEVKPLKPLWSSKEIITGIGTTIGGIGVLTPNAQQSLIYIAAGAVIVFGLYVIINRLVARSKGER